MAKAVMVCVLPGPDRKRTDHLYRFRMVHKGDPSDPCQQVWQVDGGRQTYQVVLNHKGMWECSCAAGVYSKSGPCKHAKCLMAFTGDGK